MLVTLMPGMACEMASPLKNSSSVSHLRLWTNSRNSQPLRPPPKLVNPIRLKIRNSCGELMRLEEASSMGGPNLDHRLRALTSPAEAYLLSAGAHTIGERRMHFFWCYSLSYPKCWRCASQASRAGDGGTL